ncbi:MAG: GntR family transcriptional regulator [Thermoguttaceae bacterium]|nr:GntR family transcriptional regulator [Thermoguttaceae bacterium]
MHFTIDANGPIPIYEQVTEQICGAIASGVIRPGESIPSVRELARTLAINPNTAARVCRELQSNSIVSLSRGVGLIVTEEAPKRCVRRRVALFENRAAMLINEGLRIQLDLAAIERIIHQQIAERRSRQNNTPSSVQRGKR